LFSSSITTYGEDIDEVRRHIAEDCVQPDAIVKKLSGAWAQHGEGGSRSCFAECGIAESKETDLIVRKNIYSLNNYKKLLRSPRDAVQIKKDKLQNFSKNLDRCVNENLRNLKKELNNFESLLFSNSMSKTLKKGYSIISKSKKIINNSKLIQPADEVKIQFFDKSIDVKIKKIN